MSHAVIVCVGFLIWRYLRRPTQRPQPVAAPASREVPMPDDFGPVPTQVADNVIPALLHDLRQARAAHDLDGIVTIEAELDRLLRAPVLL